MASDADDRVKRLCRSIEGRIESFSVVKVKAMRWQCMPETRRD